MVRTLTAMVLLALALVDTMVFGRLTLLFDVAFVVTCVVAALAVRPRDFFIVGVLPPLSMLVIVAVLAALDRVTVAEPGDGLVQATVSGLAHHAGALVVGYSLTLAILALRQVAYRNAGTIRSGARSSRSPGGVPRPAARASSRRDAPLTGSAPAAGGPRPSASPTTESPMPAQRPVQERLHQAR